MKTLNIYFYNGFSKPEVVATSVKELVSSVTVFDNYLGDKTPDMIEELDDVYWGDIEELNNVLSYYDMSINPNLEYLVELTLKWFTAEDFPYHLLSDFGTRAEIYDITMRTYDDFKNYWDYRGKFIIEDWIIDKYHDSVIDVFDTLEDAEDFMNKNDTWEDMVLLGVNYEGRAFAPRF